MYSDLTPQEKAKPYAKYFYQQTANPSPDLIALMDKPIDSAQALKIEDINELLKPGYLETEAGWCVLPNGAAYVANCTKMPGVTIDMVNWWFAWHSLEDLRYKLWWPKGHYAISLKAEDRAKVLAVNAGVTERFQGITHYVTEDTGCGPENIEISFLTPEELGFDMSRFKPPYAGTVVGANGRARKVGALPFMPKAPAVMCHFLREIPGGVEFRSRFWLGYQMVNKKPKLKMPPFGLAKIPAAVPKGLGIHNVYEYANLAAILPQLYAEQGGKIE